MANLLTIKQNNRSQKNKINSTPSATGAVSLNLSNGQFLKLTITGNTTFSFANALTNRYNILVLELVNAGNYTITWPGSIVWSGAVAPTLSTNGVDIISLISSDGANWKATRSWRT